MEKKEILQELFDKKLIKIINVFLEDQEEYFSLSQISELSKVNITTTFRNLDKLIGLGLIKVVPIGKAKFYQLAKTEKASHLHSILKTEGNEISEFINKIKTHPRIKKIILESKKEKEAKIIMVGDFLPRDRIQKAINDIKLRRNFKIKFIEITEKQFNEMKKLNLYDISKKIIWEDKQD